MTHHNAERGPWFNNPGMSERLIELHALTGMATLSMREISDKLSFEFALVTRNAVIGRCQRMCLPSRPTGKRIMCMAPKKARKRKRSPRSRVVVEPIAPQMEPQKLTWLPLTIYDLNNAVCHFPLGETFARPPYFYCGKPALREGCFWCPEHYARTHVVARERSA